MTIRHAVLMLALGVVASACAKPKDLVVLMPDPEDGKVGKATVTAGGASVTLDAAGSGSRVGSSGPPSAPAPVAEQEVARIFGSALSARPRAPQTFLLYFEPGGAELTAESVALLPRILDAVRNMPTPELTVIGHTDRTGEAETNVRVGLARAEGIRDRLLAAGVEPRLIEVASHGESNPLVATDDNVAEPRNRRVEVTIR